VVESLESVVISAQHLEETLPEQLAQYGTRVTTVSSEEVRNGAYLDVSQTLQALTPGLFIQTKNGPFDYANISLVGSRTEDVLFLIDGVRINNRLYGGTSPTDTLPAGMIDHIEVLEGAQSATRVPSRRPSGGTCSRMAITPLWICQVVICLEPTAYYFSHHRELVSLPAYRIILDDTQQTRYYLDPVSGQVLSVVDSNGRWYRWLHQALHRTDFSAAIRASPTRDVFMVTALVGMALVSALGTYLGLRR